MGHDSALPRLGSTGDRRVRFRGGKKPLLAFLSAFVLYAIVANKAKAGLGGVGISTPFDIVGTIGGIAAMGIVVWLLLRYEGLRARDVGLAPTLVLPGIVAVGGLWLGLNAIGIGLDAVARARSSVGYRYETPLLLVAALAIEQYLFVGLLEEFAFRGYLQNKLIALFDGYDGLTRTALGIGAASAVFAAMHLPNRLFVKGLPAGDLAANLGFLAVAGVVLGVLYELTRNAYFVGLLHGTGNLWPLFVDPGAWPSGVYLLWLGGGGVLLGATVWSYRRWVRGTSTTIRRRPVGFHR